MKPIIDALTFDDVLLQPEESQVTPADVDINTQLSSRLTLDIPILSSAMDTVSETDMGLAMAGQGGLSVIHRNMPAQYQAAMVASIKGRDLKIGAAIGTGEDHLDRAKALIDAGVDMIVVDTAHGHSHKVLEQIKTVRALCSKVTLCGGNIATQAATKALIDAGVDCVKVGVGPGSICTTRIVAGIGVPQLTAIMNVAKGCAGTDVKIIADGGLRHSGDIVKALAAGADAVMIGSLLAGSDESPGEILHVNGQSFKAYRGMGSIGAMQDGSADRYFQKQGQSDNKLVAEGVEGLVKAKGPVADILHQLIGGLRSGMGYLGAPTIADMRDKAQFVKITNAGLRESHVHDLASMTAAPNYHG